MNGPIGRREIYLDWNATTPIWPEALQAVQQAQELTWANPASVHAAGRRARAVLEETREAIAVLLGCHSRDVVLTSGGTEANNLALHAAKALVTSCLEHPSVVQTARALSARGIEVRWLPVPATGAISADSVEAALAGMPEGTVVAVMAANHETGVIQPMAEIAEVTRRLGALLHVDAVQALGKLAPDAWAGANSIALTGHKIRGPKGMGALAWRNRPPPSPLLVGGSQERGLRPGTQDAALAAGFLVALRRAATGPQRQRSLGALRDQLEERLSTLAQVNGKDSARLPHVSSLSFAGWRGAELAAALDLEGLLVSSGSACSAGTSEPSVVINAMLGLSRAQSTVRFSLGEETTEDEITRAIAIVLQVVARRT